MYKRIKIIIPLITILIFITGCGNPADTDRINTEGSPQVNLIITKEFGREEIFNKKVEFEKNWTVYDVLEDNVELGTDYGGGFISNINGIESNFESTSGNKRDWFYYVNGVCSDVGALDYDLRDGDVIWWDYHLWEAMGSTNSTVIGMYPEPFINGYRKKPDKTLILTLKEDEKIVELKESLSKEDNEIEIKTLDSELIEDRIYPTIVIGEWEDIKEIEYIKKLNESYEKTGIYMNYKEDELYLMNSKNESSKNLEEDFGTIASHGEGLGDENPLWIISGSSSVGVGLALDLLINNNKDIMLAYSLAVTSDGVIKLPLE